jgi:hypothetical protein
MPLCGVQKIQCFWDVTLCRGLERFDRARFQGQRFSEVQGAFRVSELLQVATGSAQSVWF